MLPLRWPLPAVLVAAAVALPGCGATSARPGSGDTPHLVASFYPLQWTAQQVAGRGATVASLTKAGAEPHDLELTPQDVERVAEADLVVYLKGFQPAVDTAVRQEADTRAYDVSKAAALTLPDPPSEEGKQPSDEAGGADPHFWLDPVRLARVADALATRLGAEDQRHAARYRANAGALKVKLDALDREFATGLARCASKNLVTSHTAFGYLAHRYGLTQIGITGLTPDSEPTPADLARVTEFVRRHSVRTIYYETLVSPSIARTVADETGARTAVLDPIEGLTSRSRGKDYLQVMRSNLATLRKGQSCR